ncbi:hypothetical protein [Natrarchaeobaculum aegyptiacum]|uniref:Uncharacterized protein n=1 Tax=Natrarchaeobaculum aegyptiacum TaxID=745377 RepID=A0A2Z2HZ48_9EURY|nr:hypothetical protein [Natrarchaeobaculum aegyptiacum]ARS90464.1 hypothetical protein B1756_12475 [Natrarchaeobaculum aegyptiacum]
MSTTTGDRRNLVSNASTMTTIADAVVEFAKGRRKAGALLLGAAAISRRVPGFGTAVSIGLRVYRRLG